MSEISRNQAAKILKISPRTLSRLVEQGDIERLDSGFFSKETIEEYAESLNAEEKKSETQVAISQLSEGYSAAVSHAERLIQLLEKPINNALTTLTTLNATTLQELQSQRAAHLEMMQTLGELLLQKTEREAAAATATARTEAIIKAGTSASQYIPKILDQLTTKNVLKSFSTKLNDTERKEIWMLEQAFYDDSGKPTEKSEAFKQLLKAAGIAEPPKEEPPKEEPHGHNG